MPKLLYYEDCIKKEEKKEEKKEKVIDWENKLIKAIYEDDFNMQRLIFNQLFPSLK
jgi:hypothetical protein